MEWMALVLFACVCGVLLFGYPVALTLAGVSLIFAGIGALVGGFDASYLTAMPNRLFGIVSNETLIAVPLFVFMGVMLEKSKVAESLLVAMAALLGKYRSGMAVSVVLVGMLLAASTGIVGATVVTMGLLSLPSMLNRGYSPAFATGAICATGTLGQIIPPSIALILLGDVLSSAYQKAQLSMGIFSPDSVSVGDLFVGALVPGLLLVVLYLIYVMVVGVKSGKSDDAAMNIDATATASATEEPEQSLFSALVPPLLLIIVVLGSILAGFATPTEAAGVGASGALLLAAFKKQLSLAQLKVVTMDTTRMTAMVFMILIGASVFSLVFRGFGGEELIHGFLTELPGGVFGAMLVVMLVVFALGFILDFIEITFVVVPIVAPVLLAMGIDPVWLGIMLALNLQTSFLTPPFGFALFYLRGVAPPTILTSDIYRGVVPFIIIQIVLLIGLAIWPELATWLPETLYS
ncbi:TRAP transporter, DctM subunit [Marisediminitalea aggregata]|jgi:tripartite ATP-independent transporter DctM subunit|uniref:TRAP transporter large permease protein n=1 Tax=Marisediminitalea aggregata TaxID=634436 RepID=A0A1M5RSE5_9ALTE|nr:TRAP transporter large permease subunit [Marisediminitalea aggregata]MAP19588.1 C4-dicarboxylate ABC transporter [Alteromonadaceae bacterium]MEC7471035.1 TRAP transporter large permease subunit [Pseudomonadota bacterium]HBY41434.1 C4-dicarboxylate ABC transporter [Alteromonas sp.]MAX41332.1 C4-dicarboxylate ABC transporter [Alteromonadaceae bacterium]MCP9478228.1 TRAP transporter large permease subunit [Marisediminitalea aggregata]|tara:strand:- start:2828 stop:4216 length:1389 start_codon:yes stop_codon:yes gene_type:complete